MLPLILTSMFLAAVPAWLFRSNLRAYRPAPPLGPRPGSNSIGCSILIPARNEENAIAAAVAAALASLDIEVEVLVGDDHSEDRTAAVVRAIAADDHRVRLVAVPELPAGWNGKQHACWSLAREARYPVLAYVDADVRLAPDAIARMAAFLDASGAALASGIPCQETVGLMERLLIPLIHFVLLGFLPIRRMRKSCKPSFGAGCGQLFIARADAYRACGGHLAVRSTLHDGLKLPRTFRAAGYATDLFDATDLATCRMYRTPAEVWRGLAKNAREALAAPSMIVPMTIVLVGGQVLPVVLLVLGLMSWPRTWSGLELALAAAGTAFAYYPRLAGVLRFDQSLLGALLHPLGITLLVAIQWFAFVRGLLGRPAIWKGRVAPELRRADRSTVTARETDGDAVSRPEARQPA